MLRAVAFASVLALTAGAAFAQPPGDANADGAQPPAQSGYPGADQGYPQEGAPGYGQGGYGHGGGGRWGHDPQMRALRQQMRAACATDLSTYCADAGQGGHGALHQCMMANHDKFSPPCQQAVASMMSYAHQMRGQDGGGGAAPSYAPPAGGYAPSTGGYASPPPGGYPMPQGSPQPQ